MKLSSVCVGPGMPSVKTVTVAPEAWTTTEGKLVKLTHTLLAAAEMDGWSPNPVAPWTSGRRCGASATAAAPCGVVGTMSPALRQVSPPSVDSATKMSPLSNVR